MMTMIKCPFAVYEICDLVVSGKANWWKAKFYDSVNQNLTSPNNVICITFPKNSHKLNPLWVCVFHW